MKHNKYKPYIRRRHNKDYYKIGFSIVKVPIVFKYVLVQSEIRHRVILAADSRTQLIKFVEDAVPNYKEWVKISKLKRKLVDPGTLIPNFNIAVLNIMNSTTKHPIFTDYKIICNDPVVELNIPDAYKPNFKVNEVLKQDCIELIDCNLTKNNTIYDLQSIEFIDFSPNKDYEKFKKYESLVKEKTYKLLTVDSKFLEEDPNLKEMSNTACKKILGLKGINNDIC